MTEWNIQELNTILKHCGDIALRWYEMPRARLKDDLSIVTEADHEIENYLESIFSKPDQGTYIIGEENIHLKNSSYTDKAFSSVAWIVDPIDGTAPYSHHIPTWGISIARMEGGHLTDGAIYLPITGELFISDGSDVFYCPNLRQQPDELLKLEPVNPEVDKKGMIALSQITAKQRLFSLPNPVQAIGCAVLPLSYLLLGRYLAYVGSVKLWDAAGAIPLLLRHGFSIALMNGVTIDGSIDSSTVILDQNDPNRWRFRDHLAIGSTPEAVAYMQSGISE